MSQRLKTNPDYRRLKQGGLGLFGSTSYWLGRDHLLIVEVANYSERYRRFYFRDIQAMTIQNTSARTFVSAILTLPALAVFLWLLVGIYFEAISGWQDLNGRVAVMVLSVTTVFLLLLPWINWIRGSTCSVHVRTAVQTQRLRGLTRWRKAEELMNELTPLIQSAQSAQRQAVTPAPDQPAQAPPESPGA